MARSKRLLTIEELNCCLRKLQDRVTVLEATSSGNATLVAGTIAVADKYITANSIVVLGRKTISGTAGTLSYVLNPGVGFTINSSSGTDAGVVSYSVKH